LTDGEQLAIGRAARGVYIYLAVRGGVDAASVLGSRSTDTLTGIGPLPVADGDIVPVGVPPASPGASDHVEDLDVPTAEDGPIQLTPGPHADLLPGVLAELTGRSWQVTPAADRTGLRLQGEPLSAGRAELRSEGLVEGAVQVPGDGQPIVFLANHPTTGGYPVVAVVRHGDIGRVAQARPGSVMQFAT
jgi:allophanate hydrolase subunit 2